MTGSSVGGDGSSIPFGARLLPCLLACLIVAAIDIFRDHGVRAAILIDILCGIVVTDLHCLNAALPPPQPAAADPVPDEDVLTAAEDLIRMKYDTSGSGSQSQAEGGGC